MSLREAIQKAQAAKARLEDFSANEVSLVDLAANGRKLVVVKSATKVPSSGVEAAMAPLPVRLAWLRANLLKTAEEMRRR